MTTPTMAAAVGAMRDILKDHGLKFDDSAAAQGKIEVRWRCEFGVSRMTCLCDKSQANLIFWPPQTLTEGQRSGALIWMCVVNYELNGALSRPRGCVCV